MSAARFAELAADPRLASNEEIVCDCACRLGIDDRLEIVDRFVVSVKSIDCASAVAVDAVADIGILCSLIQRRGKMIVHFGKQVCIYN